MAVFQGDLVVRRCLVDGLEDLRQNMWLLDDVFSQCATITSLKQEFGYREIANARRWFAAQDIPVSMAHREDDPRLPCITVDIGPSPERLDRASMSDEGLAEELDSTQTVSPSEVQPTPVVVLGPFTPKAYDPATGLITLPDGVTSADVFPDQSVRDPRDGRAYQILEVPSGSQIRIAAGVTNATLDGATVVPRFQTLSLRRQLSYFGEQYTVGLHVAGDPAQLLWLWSIAMFLLLRYKRSLLEENGFEISTFQSSPMVREEWPGVEKVYGRYITLSGVVQNDWIEYVSPKVEGVSVARVDVESNEDSTVPEDYTVQGWGTRKP